MKSFNYFVLKLATIIDKILYRSVLEIQLSYRCCVVLKSNKIWLLSFSLNKFSKLANFVFKI